MSRTDRFEELMETSIEHREHKLLTQFLEETAEAINARYDTTVGHIMADFDRFRKDALQHYDNEFYAHLFTTLSYLIKHCRLDDWHEFNHRPTPDSADHENEDEEPINEILASAALDPEQILKKFSDE